MYTFIKYTKIIKRKCIFNSRDSLNIFLLKKCRLQLRILSNSSKIRTGIFFFCQENVPRSSEDQRNWNQLSNGDTALGVYEVNTRGTIRRNVCRRWSG